MRLRVSNLLPLLVMLLLAGLSLWLRIAVEVPSGDAPNRQHDPDAIVENFSVKRLDEHGQLSSVLKARRMTHYADDDSTVLAAPELVRRSDGPQVTITADRGRVINKGDEAVFEGNVRILRMAEKNRPPLQVRTESLQILIDKHIVRTNQRVVITEGQRMLTGVGLEFEKDAHRFTLFSQVRGSFEPARN